MPSITIRRRVYYDDTDGGGVVYHTNYLKFMEHARSEFLDVRGYAPWIVNKEHRVLFVVADLTVRYLAPARLGDELEIEAELIEASAVTVKFKQKVWLLDVETKSKIRELVSADIKIVCLHADTFKPTRIPSKIQESILSEC